MNHDARIFGTWCTLILDMETGILTNGDGEMLGIVTVKETDTTTAITRRMVRMAKAYWSL